MKGQPSDFVMSAAAGVVATVPMTVVMERLHRLLPSERGRPLPPREVTEGVYARMGGRHDRAHEGPLSQATLLAHYAFGGAAGSLFPLIAPRGVAPAAGAGLLYGLGVWSASYLGLLPSLGVRHNATRDTSGRTAMMIAAHLVWGATLGVILRSRPGRRTASRDPDAAAD